MGDYNASLHDHHTLIDLNKSSGSTSARLGICRIIRSARQNSGQERIMREDHLSVKVSGQYFILIFSLRFKHDQPKHGSNNCQDMRWKAQVQALAELDMMKNELEAHKLVSKSP
jgi:hypothetical protein